MMMNLGLRGRKRRRYNSNIFSALRLETEKKQQPKFLVRTVVAQPGFEMCTSKTETRKVTPKPNCKICIIFRQLKLVEMGGECSTKGTDEKCQDNFSPKS